MAAIELTVSTGAAFIHSADFVSDSIKVTLPETGEAVVPLLWTETTTEQDVIDGINLYIEDPEITVEGNWNGLIVPLESATHPSAEVTGQDMDNNLLQFKWLNGPYSGDCATHFVFTTETTTADIVAAIIAVL